MTTSWASRLRTSRSIALLVREDSFVDLLGVISDHKGQFVIHFDIRGYARVLKQSLWSDDRIIHQADDDAGANYFAF